MSSQDALKRSLAAPERLLRGDVEVEAREITGTGHVTSYGARAISPVERYKRRGQLTLRQVRAAEMLYRCWATGVERARIEPAGCTAYSPTGWTDAQIQAFRCYQAARDTVGRHLWPLAFHVACLDWTCEKFANERGRNSTSTLEALRYALDMVGDAFGLPD